MKRFIWLLMISSCFAGSVVAQPVKKKVAVYVTGEVESGYKKVIGAKMVSGITQSEDYIAVERTADFLAALEQEHDYQTSGAVNDNQIVKLGQQFGVQFVVVVDVSEIFESMFFSARMIDVQTGQITGSAEASRVVESLEDLTSLSAYVASALLDGVVYRKYLSEQNVSDVKVLGPFLTDKELYYHQTKIPDGYHVASFGEMSKLIEAYRKANKHISFPVYAGISLHDSDRSDYYKFQYAYWKFTGPNAAPKCCHTRFNINNQNPNGGTITPGYVYLIRNN